MSAPVNASQSHLLGEFGWFEDFTLGRKMRHSRSSTVDELEGSGIAKQVLNTADAHWNEHAANGLAQGRLVFGLATGSLVLGLTGFDTMEQALAELSYTNLRFSAPVTHMDTITAYSEVIDVRDSDRADAGIVTFRHYGVRQDGVMVFSGERTALIKRNSHWKGTK
ncbi:MAG: MaoC family dehydratase [Cumulibacter sp.]